MDDIRKGVKSDDFSSGAMDLIQQFNKEGKFDYAIIDLNGGQGWLTSRLFIFSTLLSVLRGIKYWVFVDSNNSINKKYIGYIDSKSLRLRLADKFPWLPISYSESLIEVNQGNLHNLESADNWTITQLIQHFLKRIQKENKNDTIGDDQGEISEGKDWVLLNGKATFEKARLININQLRIIFGDLIVTSSIDDINEYSENQIIEKILLNNESHIPLINSNNYFIEMINLDHLKKNILKRKKM